MDDLKLYEKKKEELKSLAETVRIFTEDVKRMRLGLQKWRDKEDDVEMMTDRGECEYT